MNSIVKNETKRKITDENKIDPMVKMIQIRANSKNYLQNSYFISKCLTHNK